MISRILFLERLPHKHVLLVHGIAFTQGLGKGGEEVGELIVGPRYWRNISVRGSPFSARRSIRPSWYRATDDAIYFLDGEVDVLKMRLRLPPVPNALTLMAMPTQMAENMSMMYRVIVLFFLITKRRAHPHT